MKHQQSVKFESRKDWFMCIAAMVREGITFEAFDFNNEYIIVFTGGY